MKKVLVLGGGFAGVEAAIQLSKNKYNVTLVSEREYVYIYPTSIWIPTHLSEFGDSCLELAKLQKIYGFDLIIDEVKAVEAKNNRVVLAKKGVISDYDYLVIAMGAHKVKHSGAENTFSICGTPNQSIEIQKRLDELIASGKGRIAVGFAANPKDESSVRGGPSFELIFNIHHVLKKKKLRDNFELTFFSPLSEPGKKMGPQTLKMMGKMFEKMKIQTSLGKKITRFEKDGIVFEDDTKLQADLVLFTPAGSGHKVMEESDLPMTEAGFIKVNDYCEVSLNGKISNVYAIGDTANLEGPKWRAKQGHVAEIMARNTAYNIASRDKGSSDRKGYKNHLTILCVMDSGNGAAFVFRSNKRAFIIPMPIIGHLLKKAWGLYWKNVKLNRIPRIPAL